MRNIPLILFFIMLIISGCANEKRFVKFYQKCTSDSSSLKKQQIPAAYCNAWYPVKPITITTIQYKEGKTKEVPAETKYITIDCDSVVRNSNNNPATKVVKVKVPVYLKQDTVFIHDSTSIQGGPAMTLLDLQNRECASNMGAQKKETEKYKEGESKWRRWCLWTWGILAIVIILRIVLKYFTWK